MNSTTAIHSIDVCTSDWQSRSPTEILLKALVVHFSTAVLLSQYGARCDMPLRETCWFVVRGVLFPLWAATALLLNIATGFWTYTQQGLERGSTIQPLYASIGMYAAERYDDILPRVEGQAQQTNESSRNASHLPRRIPLAEIDRFTYCDPDDQGRTLRCRPTKPTPLRKRSLTILIILIYIAQALTTLFLMARRSQFANHNFTADGSPVEVWSEHAEWWRLGYHDGFREGFRKAPAITPPDSATIKLAIFGILIALCYIFIEVAGIKWEFVEGNEPWGYIAEESEPRAQRCTIGICFSYLADYTLHRTIGTLSTYRRAWAIFMEVMRLISNTPGRGPGNLAFIILGGLILLVVWQSKPFKTILPIWFRSRVLLFVSISYLPRALFHSFDFSHQDQSPYRFLETNFEPRLLKPGDRKDILNSAFAHQLRYFLYVSAWAVPLIVFGVIRSREDFWTSRPILERMTTGSGCTYRADLDAWKWKDPLADMLWAF